MANVCGLPAVVIHTGSSLWIGRGNVFTATSSPSGPGNETASPRHKRRTWSSASIISFLRFSNESLRITKSSGIHPEANEIAARPLERLSTTDHSSAIRTGLWSGATTLPERSCTFLVIIASAALVTDGFGYRPPKLWKCRSGVQTAVKPCSSANFAPSVNSRYLFCGSSPWSAEK